MAGGENLPWEGDGRDREFAEPRDGGWDGEHFWGGEFFREGGSKGVVGRWAGILLLPSGLVVLTLIA